MRYDDLLSIDSPDQDAGAPPPHGDFPLHPEPPRPEPRRRRFRWLKPALLGLTILFVLTFLWLLVTAPLSRSLQPLAPPSITLLAADGTPIARKGANVDRPVKIADLPANVPNAFIAIEDRRFYHHWGIDPKGILRAAWHNLRAGGVREGGSTITQQLAKGAFLNDNRNLGRKAQEVLIAFWLEAWLTKQQILERYLSNVYFGDNVYGLRAAAEHYFSREPEDLTLSQAAMLAGLMKAPSRLAPTSNLSGARARAKLVLNAMAEAGFITKAQARNAPPARLRVHNESPMPTGTYFADWVMPDARDQSGDLYEERKVESTLEPRLQRMAEAAVRRAPLGGAQIALVAMRPDGRVVAMVGGKNYKESPFNRATQARRQPGSTFKLFVYLAALRAGMTPDSIVEDRPITIDGWSPTNHDKRYRGKITLREAFAVSSNVAAARLAHQVGRGAVIQAARDLGITSPLGDQPSLALGTSGVTLLELTSAYAAVAGNAMPVRPYGLPKQQEGWLASLWHQPKPLGKETRAMLLDLLSATVSQGTAHNARLEIDSFGKTGTTQDNRDAIFVGFAGDLVVGVWVGRDDNQPLKGVAGGGLPARVWRDFMAHAVPGAAPPPPAPDEPVEVNADENGFAVSTDIGDMQLGAQIDGNGLRFSARPGDSDRMPPPDSRPDPRDEPDGYNDAEPPGW